VIKEYERGGHTFVSIENQETFVEFLPEVGGKMTQLLNKKTGTQFLLGPQNEEEDYKQAAYGADFEKFDTSGFDECFPTIEESVYRQVNSPEQETGKTIPDHGELWSRPWDYEYANEILYLSIDGVKFDYTLKKTIHLDSNSLHIQYNLLNNGAEPFTYLWSAHPLLKVDPGAEILLRDNIDKVFVNWASDPDIGRYGDYLPWPYMYTNGRTINYAIVQDKDITQAAKVFSPPLQHGFAGVYIPEKDETVAFEFDVEKTPFLGIWLCYGGWPATAENKHLTVGLEPTNGWPDSLENAVNQGECSSLDAGAKTTWPLTVSLWEGIPQRLH